MKDIMTLFCILLITLHIQAAETDKTPPAEEEWEISSEARDILMGLEEAGKKYATLKSDSVTYTVTSPVTGDSEKRTGWVAFQRETQTDDGTTIPTRFRITFDTLQLGSGKATRNKVDYIFDGQWLTIAKHKIKSMQRIQIAAEGEKIDALKIGQGPFPIPFGQKVDDIVSLLEASTREPVDTDPENTSYLKLIPRKNHKKDINFVRMEMWVDNDTMLPVKVISKDSNKSITTVEFEKTNTSGQLKPDTFQMKKPAGWDVTIERKKPGARLLPDIEPKK